MRVVGIDVGVRHFLADSDGRHIENRRYYEKSLGWIRVLQHWLIRKLKGSKNRERVRIKLAKVYERLVNQRQLPTQAFEVLRKQLRRYLLGKIKH